jgi:CRISPR-associated endonuclease Csn1
VDPHRRRRVEATRGGVTAFLRDEWRLSTILGGGEKTRDDHRQHALDALVVALTEPPVIKRLGDAAEHAPLARRRRFAEMPPPWPAFLDDARNAITALVVSHRVSRKVSAALHEETIYSKPSFDENGKPCVHVRKPLQALSPKDLSAIVDPAVRNSVIAKLASLGEKDPAKAFKAPENHPSLRARDGRDIPVHTVRLRVPVTTESIGAGPSARHVKLGSNHHVEILETTDKTGNPRWQGCVVTMLEATRRLRAPDPVVQKDHGPGRNFLFSLAGGEIVELDAEQDKRGLYVVEKVTRRGEGSRARVTVGIVGINDARPSTGREKGRVRELTEPSPEVLRNRGCRKVLVTPLGEVRRAHD